MTPLLSEGQSPIEKYLALTDREAGIKAVEYFIRTGELCPNIDWARQIKDGKNADDYNKYRI